MKNMMNWLYQNWPKAVPFLAFYVGIMLFLYVKDENYPLFLIWLQTIVYWIHETEEYIYPGGFLADFNRNMMGAKNVDQTNPWPLTLAGSFWINIPLVFVAMPIAGLMSHFLGVQWGLWAAYFSALNALSHVGMFLKFHKYNPGLIVSTFLNIPVGVYTVWYCSTNLDISTTAHILNIIVGIIAQVSMMIYGFGILKPMVKRGLGH